MAPDGLRFSRVTSSPRRKRRPARLVASLIAALLALSASLAAAEAPRRDRGAAVENDVFEIEVSEFSFAGASRVVRPKNALVLWL
ncbi:hypothetical protein ATCC90586_001297 [Pythium insidiosum]|nr:hypothetical protein ATCC90586_001297 [Pythium insidiosum]